MTRTLLLADGSVTIQRVIELTFAHEDIRVMAASDGRKAMQMLEGSQPDIVLADVDLPEVDGYALAAHIRRVPRLKDVPVLLLAGAFEPVDQARARDAGSDGVIMKPFEPQVVVTRVKELIDQRARMAAPLPARGGEAGAGPTSVAAPEPAKPARIDPAYPRSVPGDLIPVSMPEIQGVPETLELPVRPVWDVRGSAAHGEAPPAGMPFPPAPPAIAAPPPKVTLANAFTALLAAEQSNQPAQPAAAPVSEASIEDAVRRVLVRMTDDLVRRIVVDTAERLIREEIERIKANPD